MEMGKFVELMRLDDGKDEELDAFLETTAQRFRDLLPMMSNAQLSDLACMFAKTRFNRMYDSVCSELRKRVEASAPHLHENIGRNWTEMAKASDREGAENQ